MPLPVYLHHNGYHYFLPRHDLLLMTEGCIFCFGCSYHVIQNNNIMQAASVAALITCSLTAAKTLQDLLQKHCQN